MNDYPPEYDQDCRDNSTVEQAFSEFNGPGELYRAVYKYTECGPGMGVCIQYIEVLPPDGFHDYPSEVERSKWIYCDELYSLGSWSDMADKGLLILALSVSSIVEGVDQTTDTHEISCDPDHLELQATKEEGDDLHKTLRRLFYRAVDLVNEEADEIWQATHGCDICAQHWASQGITEGMYGPMEGYDGATHVWKDCPECQGHGVAF